jgi:KDO2-lipid IV(A) lauroyltransferase
MNTKKQYKPIKLYFFILGYFPNPMLTFFADSLGVIWYTVDKKHRRIVIGNIRAAYPEKFTGKKAERFALKNFQHTIGILFEVIWSYSIDVAQEISKLSEPFVVLAPGSAWNTKQ